MSVWALTNLLDHEVLGQRARYERFMAKMVYVLAGGQHIDTDRTEGFAPQVEEAYKNPFEAKHRKKQPQTAAEIRQYVICLLEGREWT